MRNVLTCNTFDVQSYPYEGVTNYCKKNWGETVKFKKVLVLVMSPLFLLSWWQCSQCSEFTTVTGIQNRYNTEIF